MSPVPRISDRPHPGLAAPANSSFHSSHPLRCPISISSACRADSAAFKDSWAAPKCCRSDRWSCSPVGRRGLILVCRGQQRLGLACGARSRCALGWVLSVAGASLALAETPALTVKQERN